MNNIKNIKWGLTVSPLQHLRILNTRNYCKFVKLIEYEDDTEVNPIKYLYSDSMVKITDSN